MIYIAPISRIESEALLRVGTNYKRDQRK